MRMKVAFVELWLIVQHGDGSIRHWWFRFTLRERSTSWFLAEQRQSAVHPSLSCCVLCVCVWVCVSLVGPTYAPLRLASGSPCTVESTHPYLPGEDRLWPICVQGAETVEVGVQQCVLLEGRGVDALR